MSTLVDVCVGIFASVFIKCITQIRVQKVNVVKTYHIFIKKLVIPIKGKTMIYLGGYVE